MKIPFYVKASKIFSVHVLCTCGQNIYFIKYFYDAHHIVQQLLLLVQ